MSQEMSRSAKWRASKRSEILKALGGACVKCGETNPKLLHVDHVKNDAELDYARGRGVYRHRLHFLIKLFPERYQLLCRIENEQKRARRQARIAKEVRLIMSGLGLFSMESAKEPELSYQERCVLANPFVELGEACET